MAAKISILDIVISVLDITKRVLDIVISLNNHTFKNKKDNHKHKSA